MSADCHPDSCKMKQEWVEQAMLQWAIFVFIYPVRMHTGLYTNSDRSSQLIETQASANRCSRSLSWQPVWVNSAFRFQSSTDPPVNMLGDRDNAITGYSTILHSWDFVLVRMWWDHVPRGFILQSDWLLKILRGAPGPARKIGKGAW